ncbi:mannonate dehydratase [Fuerstiella marisgermanici]|uniref:mannonate dehydratase n=1 Tax=Fuerstiella marisgermanici TaxID=1891926 RepID=A0A1P8WET0_9PLAN|nr:mannonate dehydratase [Fuerstiella marisgermanici]APZ92586.1 Mannonate dehydratase [Fuerstiella marisgermanici]
MILNTVLTPLNDINMRLAVQCGVEGVVVRYPGPTLDDLVAVKQTVEGNGLKLLAIEGYLPIEKIKLGTDHDGRELAAIKTLIEHMGTAGVPLLCYNFMSGTDWVRTTLDVPARGGALVTGFRLADAERAVSLNAASEDVTTGTISADELWTNLERFLREVIPVAEEAGVTLAMHPDDPPLPRFHGKARIMNSVDALERLVALVPSPRNAICFCQGTFATMGVDIPATIRRLGRHIQYVHFRDAEGSAEQFVETFHDNGPTDMAAAIRALKDVGFTGPIRPDHVPQLIGEENGEPGYTMLGRLFAFGYIRGLLHGTGASPSTDSRLPPGS